MKKMQLNTLAAIISLSSIQLVQAGTQAETVRDLKNGASFTAGAVIGAAAGGPIGMLVGALGGGLLAEKSNKAFDEKMSIQNALTEKDMSLTQLEVSVDRQKAEITRLEKMLQSRTTLSLYFDTGKDTLASGDIERVNVLSEYLHEAENMQVSIIGHSDIRGSDEYNNVLSKERAESVAKMLSDAGIGASRISAAGQGSRFAKAVDKNASEGQLGLDRNVRIELFSSDTIAEFGKR